MTDPTQLDHLSLNPTQATTILLLHGAFGNAHDWDRVAASLPSHHLLIPSLFTPASRASYGNAPPTARTIADKLAQLVRAHAHAHAHVVGFSLGATYALALATAHPDACRSLFVSGCSPGGGPRPALLNGVAPYVLYGVERAGNALPRSWWAALMDGVTRPRDEGRASGLSVQGCREALGVMQGGEGAAVGRVACRAGVVAATKSGVVPSFDSVAVGVQVAKVCCGWEAGRGAEPVGECTVFEAPGMRHPWINQDPALFAAAVVAWIEGREMPDGLEERWSSLDA